MMMQKTLASRRKRGCNCLLTESNQRLLLEYNASGGTVSCGQSGYLEAKSFTDKTYWYIGTIVSDFWSNVHGLFFAVNGVGLFTDGHNNFGLAKGVGNGACIVIPYNFCAKSFAQCTEWYIGTIVSNVWSSIFNAYYFVVNNKVIRANGHNNAGINRNILFANSIFQGLSIRGTIFIGYNNNDVKNGFLIGVHLQISFTICYGSSAACNRGQLNFCISVGAVFNVSVHFLTSFDNFTICIYNRNINSVGLANLASFAVKCEGVVGNRVNNRQGLYNLFLNLGIVSSDGHFSTKKVFSISVGLVQFEVDSIASGTCFIFYSFTINI